MQGQNHASMQQSHSQSQNQMPHPLAQMPPQQIYQNQSQLQNAGQSGYPSAANAQTSHNIHNMPSSTSSQPKHYPINDSKSGHTHQLSSFKAHNNNHASLAQNRLTDVS